MATAGQRPGGAGTVGIPDAGEYRIDAERSAISFTTRHLFGLAPVHGTFRLREGHLRVGDPVSGSAARATVSAASVDTGNAQRDASVRSATYLDAEAHPDITFASTGLARADGHWTLHGDLTVRGRTRPVALRIDSAHPDGGRVRLGATCEVDRYEFGITAMRGMTGRRLTLRLDVTAERT
ncbi:polyisoprenoid-binding protein YceI [Prauserella shujinwangii]|uniref:Polyisoprenoid-binding protein YceI n=1 Tax=Prauserella shujinwangii TaxID=1453103 RepID=A0A2T0LLW1_9PSEU|nr:YceI family protein [Prauserella shujinwangii]PRX44022.1 polyisoprenoid-binding protein YceI [Prauserella shujinwangii]